jgi:hypothetical protein
MKNSFIFLFAVLISLIACQKQEQTFENQIDQSISNQDKLFQSHITLLDNSILESDWWKNTPESIKEVVAMELSGNFRPITLVELQEMEQIAARKAQTYNLRGKGNSCAGFPTPNPEGNVDLSSQADVDEFGALNCKNIIGRLRIVDTLGPDPICDLSPLNKIKTVGSSLNVFSDCLTSLDGLEKIKSVGELGPFGFVAVDGNSLNDISALSALKTITGSINILSTENLTTLGDAFTKITTIGSGLTSNPIISQYVIFIDGNAVLTDISGLGNIESVERRLLILDNAAIENLDDLEALVFVGDDIVVVNNSSLSNVNKLSDITQLNGDLFLFDNAALTECCGVFNLLCSDPPSCTADNVGGLVAIFGNGPGCEVTDIVAGGPCN